MLWACSVPMPTRYLKSDAECSGDRSWHTLERKTVLSFKYEIVYKPHLNISKENV